LTNNKKYSIIHLENNKGGFIMEKSKTNENNEKLLVLKLFESIKPMLNEKQIKDIKSMGTDCLTIYGNKPEHFEIYAKYDVKYWRSLRFLRINNLIEDTETINTFLNIINTYGKDSIFVSLIQRVVECNTKLNELGMSPYIYFEDFMAFINLNRVKINRLKNNICNSKSISKEAYDENCVLSWLADTLKKEHLMVYENMVAPYFASYTETKL
jgi:hypothetical protein